MSASADDPISVFNPGLGGELQFNAGNIGIAPKDRGDAIAFPAYVVHRVTPVTAGTRKAIVAWVTGPRFR